MRVAELCKVALALVLSAGDPSSDEPCECITSWRNWMVMVRSHSMSRESSDFGLIRGVLNFFRVLADCAALRDDVASKTAFVRFFAPLAALPAREPADNLRDAVLDARRLLAVCSDDGELCAAS
mmetsp:Transcript_1978/g.5234  ORF Transcript_1978/g.5234 Transcript_1978/m.5234 type:complete len:124 (-) Transcript_1978:486-857(-)